MHKQQAFRSVLSNSIVAAAEGAYGCSTVPDCLRGRVRPGELYLWPLMAMLWGFDVRIVGQRCKMAQWIADCPTPEACVQAICCARERLAIRPVEELPTHAQFGPGCRMQCT